MPVVQGQQGQQGQNNDKYGDAVQYRLLKVNSPMARDCVTVMVGPRRVELAWVFIIVIVIIIAIIIVINHHCCQYHDYHHP